MFYDVCVLIGLSADGFNFEIEVSAIAYQLGYN